MNMTESKKLFDQVKKSKKQHFHSKADGNKQQELHSPTQQKSLADGRNMKKSFSNEWQWEWDTDHWFWCRQKAITTTVRDLYSDKEPSLDNIPAELVKANGPTAVKVLHMLCLNLRDTGIWQHRTTGVSLAVQELEQ